MRVALVASLYPPHIGGGAERSLQELAQGLTSLGHAVTVICLGPEADGTTIDDDDGIGVIRLGSPAFRPFLNGGKNATSWAKLRWHASELLRVDLARKLRAALKAAAPDVVHTSNLAGFGWLGWWTVKRLQLPLVHTIRDYYLGCLNSTHRHGDRECGRGHPACRAAKLVFRLSPRRPDLFVGVSRDIVERHRAIGALRDSESATVVYNRPRIVSSDRTLRSTSVFTFGAIGRIGADKGSWLIIDAFDRLPAALRKRSRLLIAGDATGADATRLHQLLRDRPHVTYVGTRPPGRFYEEVDCALVASQWAEPFGRTAAEALASSVPLVASRTGAIPEVVDLYGGAALLVDRPHDVQSWVAAMARAADGDLPHHPTPVGRVSDPAEQYERIYRRLSSAQAGALR